MTDNWLFSNFISNSRYNTLWNTMAGGHDDDMSLGNLEDGYGYLIDKLGCRIIQTDRPAYLLTYLRSRNLHK